MLRRVMKEQCGVIFGTCARWKCPNPSSGTRPWCADHELLDADQQAAFEKRQAARRTPVDTSIFVTTLVKWRRKLLH